MLVALFLACMQKPPNSLRCSGDQCSNKEPLQCAKNAKQNKSANVWPLVIANRVPPIHEMTH